jgi:hypothetical protein
MDQAFRQKLTQNLSNTRFSNQVIAQLNNITKQRFNVTSEDFKVKLQAIFKKFLKKASLSKKNISVLGPTPRANYTTYAAIAKVPLKANFKRKAKKNGGNSMSKNSIEASWHIYNTTTGKSFPLTIPGLASKTWILNYVKNSTAFPTIKINSNKLTNKNGYVQNSYSGKHVCKLFPGLANCANWQKSGKNQNKFTVTTKGPAVTVVKYGGSGISVAGLSKLISTAGTITQNGTTYSKGKLRAQYLELKRNGDYMQIFTCKMVNIVPNLRIIKPGSESIGRDLLNGKQVAYSNLKKLLSAGDFSFKKCCFWTLDRPAAFFAFLSGVPIVYTVAAGQKIYYIEENKVQSVNWANELTKGTGPATKILSSLISEYKKGNHINNIRPLWYLMMCIIDTAHDFVDPKRAAPIFQQMEAIKNVLKSLMPPGFDRTFIDGAFKSITAIEVMMRDILIDNAAMSGQRGKEIFEFIEEEFKKKDMCYVCDSGLTPDGNLPLVKRQVLLTAKRSDPSS